MQRGELTACRTIRRLPRTMRNLFLMVCRSRKIADDAVSGGEGNGDKRCVRAFWDGVVVQVVGIQKWCIIQQ